MAAVSSVHIPENTSTKVRIIIPTPHATPADTIPAPERPSRKAGLSAIRPRREPGGVGRGCRPVHALNCRSIGYSLQTPT